MVHRREILYPIRRVSGLSSLFSSPGFFFSLRLTKPPELLSLEESLTTSSTPRFSLHLELLASIQLRIDLDQVDRVSILRICSVQVLRGRPHTLHPIHLSLLQTKLTSRRTSLPSFLPIIPSFLFSLHLLQYTLFLHLAAAFPPSIEADKHQ